MDSFKFDDQFKTGLIIINPFIPGLKKKNDVRLCRMWIDKLIHCAPNERQLRNIYLEQLCRHSQQQILGPPFSCPPSEGPLQMIPQQFLVKQGVVLDKPVTSTVTSQTEGEMTSWSDVTNCVTSSSYPQHSPSGKHHHHHHHHHHHVRKVVSTTSTAVSENIHRTRFKRHNNRIRFKLHNKSQSLIRTKNQRKCKKPTGDSNEDFFKETETKENLQICKTTVLELTAVDKEQFIDRERILDKEKIIDLEKKVSEIEKENSVLKEQLEEVTNKKLEMDSVQEVLKNEVLHLKDKLTLIEKIKSALEEEHKEFVNNTLTVLSAHVNSAIKKNEQFAETLQLELNEEILELKKSHSEVVLGYKNNISDLKKDIAKKNKEVERLEKQLQEHCGRMKTEVENIKQELENSKELKAKNIAYKSKIMKLTSKIIKLIEHNKKIADCYEQKINVLKKSKDMELWVQKLSFGSSLTNGKKQELENIVSTLEEKFRKQLTNATQITLHNIDPTIKRLQNFYESEDNENNENNK